MFCDILKPGGEPFEGDPRFVLKRNLKKAADLGFTFYVGPELEFFYFKDSKGTETLDSGGYFDMTTLDAATDLRRNTVITLEKMASVSNIRITKLPRASTKSTCVIPTH